LKRDWVIEFNEESGKQFGSDCLALLLGDHVVPEANSKFNVLVLIRKGYASHEDKLTFFIGVGYRFVPEIGNDAGLFQCLSHWRV
jgi:hypothetical protein